MDFIQTPHPKKVMKKSELRVWALRTHSPDKWWVQVDGEVSDTEVSLDEAFRRAEGSRESYIIHAAHAEEAEDPHWIKMGADDARQDGFALPKWVCPKCGFSFEKPHHPGVSLGEILGYVLIVPGVLLRRKRLGPSNARCPHCGSKKLVPGDSRAGRVLLDR